MQGQRRPAPPFGWDRNNPKPKVGYRRKKENRLEKATIENCPTLRYLAELERKHQERRRQSSATENKD